MEAGGLAGEEDAAMKEIAGLLVLIGLITTSEASVISKSSKEECILEDDVKTLANATCATKLVVGFTVTANEVARLLNSIAITYKL